MLSQDQDEMWLVSLVSPGRTQSKTADQISDDPIEAQAGYLSYAPDARSILRYLHLDQTLRLFPEEEHSASYIRYLQGVPKPGKWYSVFLIMNLVGSCYTGHRAVIAELGCLMSGLGGCV